jgi:hypothetical protein
MGLVTVAVARAGTTIVVNFGPHPSAEVAGKSEAKVNWLDADKSDDTVCTECFAALELQHYLRKMTKDPDNLPIKDDDRDPATAAFVVGGPASNAVARARAAALGIRAEDVARLGPEGYRIKTGIADGKRTVLIAGGGRVGTLYGVYDLLHRLGVRWFAPGDVHEEVPGVKGLPVLDLDVTEKPDFLTRGFHAWEDRGNPDFLLWMARNRMNYWCVEQSNHPLVRKLGIQMSCGTHFDQHYFIDPGSPYPYDHPRFKGDEKKPKDPYPVSDQYQGDSNKDGKLSYFQAHPEWYAMVKGKRVPGIRGEGGTNYCTSNADATTEFVKNYVQGLVDGRYKSADIVRLWTLDGGRWCQCAKCKALGIPTERYLRLVHALAAGIKKARAAGRIHRPIIVRFLVYADILRPPTRPLPADFDYDMCSGTFFPIVRCYVHNFDNPACSRNSHYRRQLHGWATDPKRHYRGQLCIGEYYNVSGYKCLPICFMHTMANDIPYYHKAGARHFHYMHVVTRNWGNKALTNYQMARQLWDVKTDCEALWKDYFARRYGPAAATMRRFYESLERMLCNVSRLKYGLARRLNGGARNLFPSSHLRFERKPGVKCDGSTLLEIVGHAKECRKLIGQALAGDLPERVKGRIAEDERLFTYGERTIAYFHECVQAFQLARAGRRDDARRHFAEARRLADLLRADTASTKHSSSHASAANALVATYATGALAQLAELLGPARPEAIKRLDPRNQPLVLTGRDFPGGGAVRHGYGLYVHPGRKKVSDQGNYVYARSTGAHSRMTAWFRLDQPPKAPLALTLVGLSRPLTDTDEIPAEILVNKTSIFKGPAPFSIKALSSHQCAIPAAALVKGENKITIRNLAPKGPVGSRPWFGIDRIEVRGHPVTEQAAGPTLKTPVDLALTYLPAARLRQAGRSEADGTTEPYRVYLPSAYDGKRRLPLFVALHGTGGDQNRYFDHPMRGSQARSLCHNGA